MRARAVVVRGPDGAAALEEIDVESPRAGEVLVRVVASGICGSDLHVVHGRSVLDAFPMVLGHEGAGVVEAIGDGVTTVHVGEFQYNQKRCIRVEAIRPDNRGGEFYSYRTLIYFDKATHLPIRVESYDWPKPGGPPGGELFESYSYANMKLNPGIPEAVFNH